MDINDIRIALTVLMVLCFGGIVWWAYSSRRKQAYEEARMIPLEEDQEIKPAEIDNKQEAPKV